MFYNYFKDFEDFSLLVLNGTFHKSLQPKLIILCKTDVRINGTTEQKQHAIGL